MMEMNAYDRIYPQVILTDYLIEDLHLGTLRRLMLAKVLGSNEEWLRMIVLWFSCSVDIALYVELDFVNPEKYMSV